ncbi:MAG: hypothetical protein ACREUD_00420 [Gammaproteobacteria bacterium]
MVLALASGSADAGPAAEAQIKSSLRGVELTSSLDGLKECPKRDNPVIPSLTYISYLDSDFPPDMKGVRCFQYTDTKPLLPSASSYVIANLPLLKGAGTDVTVNLLANKVQYVEMRFLQHHSSSILAAVTEKYGKPTTSKDVTYQNGFGQSFNGVTATWNMPGAVLTFTQYDGNKDWGRVDLMSNLYRARLNQSHDSAVQDIKDKL